MKKAIILFTALFFAIGISAQESEHFHVRNDGLVWQKVYMAEGVSIEKIIQGLLPLSCVSDVTEVAGTVTCEIKGLRMNFKGAGYSRMSIPIYLANGIFYGYVTVQVREGRYRVTVERIVFENMGTSEIEYFAIKDGALKKGFLEKDGKIMDYTFDSLFSKLANSVLDDEW